MADGGFYLIGLNYCSKKKGNFMANFVVWLLTPVVIMVIIMMAISVLVFDFLYELFVNLLKSESDD